MADRDLLSATLKQLLRIKSFIGTSRNAVETQIWTALATMLILAWLKHRARYKWALANLVVSLRLNTFTKIDLGMWLDRPFTPPPDEGENTGEGGINSRHSRNDLWFRVL